MSEELLPSQQPGGLLVAKVCPGTLSGLFAPLTFLSLLYFR